MSLAFGVVACGVEKGESGNSGGCEHLVKAST